MAFEVNYFSYGLKLRIYQSRHALRQRRICTARNIGAKTRHVTATTIIEREATFPHSHVHRLALRGLPGLT